MSFRHEPISTFAQSLIRLSTAPYLRIFYSMLLTNYLSFCRLYASVTREYRPTTIWVVVKLLSTARVSDTRPKANWVVKENIFIVLDSYKPNNVLSNLKLVGSRRYIDAIYSTKIARMS
jgi:hypothetical protein